MSNYQPKEGDVIECKRHRIVIGNKGLFGCYFIKHYRRCWLTGKWGRHWIFNDYERGGSELAAMVNHMGWRVLE